MGEFRSQLFLDLVAAADIKYDSRKADNEVIYQRGGKDIFTNDDARRMDRIKTAIIRVLLMRAYNFMVATKQDSKAEGERFAMMEFSATVTSLNVRHEDGQKPKISTELMGGKFGSVDGGGAGRPQASPLDFRDGAIDPELDLLLENFVQKVGSNEQLYFNCSPNT